MTVILFHCYSIIDCCWLQPQPTVGLAPFVMDFGSGDNWRRMEQKAANKVDDSLNRVVSVRPLIRSRCPLPPPQCQARSHLFLFRSVSSDQISPVRIRTFPLPFPSPNLTLLRQRQGISRTTSSISIKDTASTSTLARYIPSSLVR